MSAFLRTSLRNCACFLLLGTVAVLVYAASTHELTDSTRFQWNGADHALDSLQHDRQSSPILPASSIPAVFSSDIYKNALFGGTLGGRERESHPSSCGFNLATTRNVYASPLRFAGFREHFAPDGMRMHLFLRRLLI